MYCSDCFLRVVWPLSRSKVPQFLTKKYVEKLKDFFCSGSCENGSSLSPTPSTFIDIRDVQSVIVSQCYYNNKVLSQLAQMHFLVVLVSGEKENMFFPRGLIFLPPPSTFSRLCPSLSVRAPESMPRLVKNSNFSAGKQKQHSERKYLHVLTHTGRECKYLTQKRESTRLHQSTDPTEWVTGRFLRPETIRNLGKDSVRTCLSGELSQHGTIYKASATRIQNVPDALLLCGVILQLPSGTSVLFLTLTYLLCFLLIFQTFQTSVLLLPVMTEARCAAKTKKATSCVTVSQAGREPGVRKVQFYVGAQRRLDFCTVIHSVTLQGSRHCDLGPTDKHPPLCSEGDRSGRISYFIRCWYEVYAWDDDDR